MSRQTKSSHRVYMLFTLTKAWHVSFLEADLTISPLRKLTLAGPEDIRDLARSGCALETSEARALFDYAIRNGGGGLYLNLTPEQYSELQKPDKGDGQN